VTDEWGSSSILPSVSVLIAAYNAESFLHRAVESALHQTFPVEEVLIVDDSSQDATASAARRLSRQDSRVRLISLPVNGGPAMARNTGLDAATGDWVAVLDADDAFLPQRLEQMLTFAQDASADVVLDSFRYYKPAKQTISPSVLDDHVPDALITTSEFVSHARPYGTDVDWGLLKPVFRRAFLEEHGLRYPLKTRHGEDFLFMVDVLLHGARCALCRQAGYLYTAGDANLSRTVRDYRRMYQHTVQLLYDERVAADPKLVRAVRQRSAAVRRLSAEMDFARFRRDHDYNSMAKRAVADNAFRMILARRLVRRLRNQTPRN
jgi:succinoglycan biosynthesis protein ExoO